ncbi:MAG: hypothetical protein QNJ35_11605 [Paracoccaceae bacterium]|nr:hypothetical protein [Paracoccaceae bacterium]
MTRLTPLFFAATIALTPADAARSAGAEEPVLEIVTFRLAEGADDAAFVEAARGTEAKLRERGALTRRFLTKDETGTWTDVIEWTSMAEALAAAEAVMASEAFAPFSAMIDPASVEMRHAPILWRME